MQPLEDDDRFCQVLHIVRDKVGHPTLLRLIFQRSTKPSLGGLGRSQILP